MKINPVNMIVPQGNRIAGIKGEETSSQAFSEALFKALQDVNELQVNADKVTEKMVLGEIDDVHTVMLATEKAKLALQLTVQVRNKLVEAYQEISRMQF